jgi:hypothetical protein
LTTAGEPGNASYLSVESGNEEWVRGSVNALLVLMEEGLVDIEQAIGDATDPTTSLHSVRGVLNGAAVSYSGRYFSVLHGDHESADTAPDSSSASSKSKQQTTDDASTGISHWVSIHDPELDVQIDAGLMSALGMTDSLLASVHADSTGSAVLVKDLMTQVEQVVQLLESEVLPLTQVRLSSD